MSEERETATGDGHGISEKCPHNAKIGLALSGGGVRASAFHMGVLKYFATLGLIQNVRFLSTVSGGSLVSGLLMSKNEKKWPTDLQAFTNARQEVRAVLTGKNLQLSALLRMLNPLNWRHLFSRANVVADSLEGLWDIKGSLGDLPTLPVWEVNGTTMETGRRWRFVSGPGAIMGDGATGNWGAKDYRLANAMAASAAFPGGVSPLQVTADPNKATLRYPDAMNAVLRNTGRRSWHIADGGVYDNLGLEPLFDASSRTIRKTCGCDFIIVSDAGSPLKFSNWALWAQGLGFGGRTIAVMHAQGRNMRTRSFVGAILAKTVHGLFLNIARSREETISEFLRQGGDQQISTVLKDGLAKEKVDQAALFKTTLWRLLPDEYDLLEQHGFETAQTQWVLYGRSQFQIGCVDGAEEEGEACVRGEVFRRKEASATA